MAVLYAIVCLQARFVGLFFWNRHEGQVQKRLPSLPIRTSCRWAGFDLLANVARTFEAKTGVVVASMPVLGGPGFRSTAHVADSAGNFRATKPANLNMIPRV